MVQSRPTAHGFAASQHYRLIYVHGRIRYYSYSIQLLNNFRYLQIIRHFDKIHKIPREELPFWIISIVKNEALSIIRKRQKTVSLENWDGYIIESENVLDYTELVNLFAKLPLSYRSVLEMKIGIPLILRINSIAIIRAIDIGSRQ